MNDLVFGNIVAGDRERTKKTNKPSSSSRGTTFVAQGCSVKLVSSNVKSSAVIDNNRSDVNQCKVLVLAPGSVLYVLAFSVMKL